LALSGRQNDAVRLVPSTKSALTSRQKPRCHACAEHEVGTEQPAKTTLFAGGNEADVRKIAAGDFSN
jgi:hypothetical protein